jgi:hypothetical protein
MVNRWYYLEVLKCLRENVRRKRPQLWGKNPWFLHYENTPAHASLLIRDFLANTTVLPQPPCSLDLAPADLSLFPKLKSTLEGRRFQTIQEINGKFADKARRDPEKGIPGLFSEVAMALGVVYQCRRRIL